MKNFIIALFLGFTALSYGQAKVTGVVNDENNQPLPGVSIYASDLQKGTTTDGTGKYSIENLPSGNVKLIFSFSGFATKNELAKLTNGSNIYNVSLVESSHQIDEVVVSTNFTRLQSQNVMKVDYESVKTLQQKGVSTMIEGLATIPGVSQISTGTSIGKPVIRGLSGNRVLVYSQGVRLENQQFGDEHGLGLNDSGVESVEVIKGPASLLYGSDALGGVLYFNPERFANANTIKASAAQRYFSNTRGSFTDFGVKGSTRDWNFLARGSYASHSDYKVPGGDRVENTRYNETDLKTGIGYGNKSFSSVLRYNFNRLDLGLPENGFGSTSKSKATEFPKQGVDNHIASLKNHVFLGKTTVDVTIGYIFNDRSEIEESNVANLRMKLKTLNYDLNLHLPKSGNVETIFGAQGMHQTNENYGTEFLIPNAVTNDIGAFATADYGWKSNVIQGGLRFDHRNIDSQENGIAGDEGYFAPLKKSFSSVNASFGYKTDFDKKFIIRLNLASGFRAPNLAELTSNGIHEGTNRYEIGNQNLRTEQNFQTDLNLEYKNEHFEVFANGFYNNVNHYIYAVSSGELLENNVVYNYTQNNARLYGAEAGIHFHPHPLDWLHLESTFATVTGERQNGEYLPLIPANSINNTLRVEALKLGKMQNAFARINVVTTFDQNDVSGFETRSPGYTLLNSGIGGEFRLGDSLFNFSVSGNNLLDRRYIAHLSRFKTDGIPDIGRNISVSVAFEI